MCWKAFSNTYGDRQFALIALGESIMRPSNEYARLAPIQGPAYNARALGGGTLMCTHRVSKRWRFANQIPGVAANCESIPWVLSRTLALQALLLVAAAMLSLGLAPWALVSAVAGGGIALLANLVSGCVALLGRRGAGAVLAAMVFAGYARLVVVAAGFVLAFRFLGEHVQGLNAGIFMVAFGLATVLQWVAPFAFRGGRSRRR